MPAKSFGGEVRDRGYSKGDGYSHDENTAFRVTPGFPDITNEDNRRREKLPFDPQKVEKFIDLIRNPDSAAGDMASIKAFIKKATAEPDYVLKEFLLPKEDFQRLSIDLDADKTIPGIDPYSGITDSPNTDDSDTGGDGSKGGKLVRTVSFDSSLTTAVIKKPDTGADGSESSKLIRSVSFDSSLNAVERGSAVRELVRAPSKASRLKSIPENPDAQSEEHDAELSCASSSFSKLVLDTSEPVSPVSTGKETHQSLSAGVEIESSIAGSDSDHQEKVNSTPQSSGDHVSKKKHHRWFSSYSRKALNSPEAHVGHRRKYTEYPLSLSDDELLQKCADFLYFIVVVSASKYNAHQHIVKYIEEASIMVRGFEDKLILEKKASPGASFCYYDGWLNAGRLYLVRCDRLSDGLRDVSSGWKGLIGDWSDLKMPNTDKLHNPDSIPWHIAGVPAGGFILGVASYVLYSLRFFVNAGISLSNFVRYHTKVKKTEAGRFATDELGLSVFSSENHIRGHLMRNDFMWAAMNAAYYHWAKHQEFSWDLGGFLGNQVQFVVNVGSVLLVVLYLFDVGNAYYKMRSVDRGYKRYLEEVLEPRREELKQEMSDLYPKYLEIDEKDEKDWTETEREVYDAYHHKCTAFEINERRIWEYKIHRKQDYIINKAMLNVAITFAVLMAFLCIMGLFNPPVATTVLVGLASVKIGLLGLIVLTNTVAFLLKSNVEEYVKFLVKSAIEPEAGEEKQKEPKLSGFANLFLPKKEMGELKKLCDEGPAPIPEVFRKKERRACGFDFSEQRDSEQRGVAARGYDCSFFKAKKQSEIVKKDPVIENRLMPAA